VRLSIALLVLGALLSGTGGALMAYAVARLLRRIGEPPLPVTAMAIAVAGLDIGTLVASVATGGTSPTMAPSVVFGSIVTTVAVGLAAAAFAVGSRGLPAPTTMGTLLPFGALTAVGLVAHDRVVTRGEGLGLVLLFALAVGATLWDQDRTLGTVAGWSARARARATSGGRATEGDPASAAPPEATDAEATDAEAPSPPGRRALARLRAGRIGLRSDLRAPALAAAGLLLGIVGGLLVARGGIRILDRTSLTAGFIGFALAGAAAGAGPAAGAVVRARRNPAKAVALVADVTAAAALFVLGLAALIRPMVVDAAGAVGFLGAAALSALAWTVLLVRRTGGRFLAIVLLVLTGGLVWSALHV
jgi:hypothetical protein